MSDLGKHVGESIVNRRLIRPKESILVAVSGGLDSMVLLHLLAELAASHKWRLTVAHFNHQLRGRSSDADERLVRTTAKKLGLEFVNERGDVKKFSCEHGFSLEMAARKLRHDFLAQAAAKRKIGTIALAHHADDQVELFFLRLLRGAGSEGLAGMKWRSMSPVNPQIHLIRPLLDQFKDGLRKYAGRSGIKFREDATNARLDMQRNRIRRELIPLLTKHYQPALGRVVLREMEVLGAEAEFVNRAALDWLKRRGKFADLPVALQRRCLQLQLPTLGVVASFGLVEELREAANGPVAVSDTVTVYRDEVGKVHAREIRDAGFDRESKRVKLQGAAGQVIFGKMLICWESGPFDSGTYRAGIRGANCECFDAKKVGTAIFLRYWRPGDRFQPIGMAFAVKLQDLFTNQRIPRMERRGRIVATTAAGEIFWVEGLRMAERFKLDTTTRRGLKWRWQRV